MQRPEGLNQRIMTPFPLNDGEDNLLIDWSGSMTDTHPQHNIPCWWYKAGRLISGVIRKEMPLIRPGMIVENAEGLEFLGSSKQDFDPETGILHTRLCCSESIFDIETLILDSTLLRKVVVRSAAPGLKIAFTLNDRRLWGIGPSFEPSQPWDYFIDDAYSGFRYSHHPDQTMVDFGELPSFQGMGLQLAWDHHGAFLSGVDNFVCHHFLHGKSCANVAKGIGKGDTLYCATVLLDNHSQQGKAYEQAVYQRLDEVRKKGYEAIAEEIAQTWKHYQSRSRITLPGQDIANYTFQFSKYTLKSSQHHGGSLPCSANYHVLGSAAYWDTWGPTSSFARLNHVEEALKIGRFWVSTLPQARKQAEALEAPGARIPWTSLPAPNNGLCTRFPQVQYHNIGVAMEMCWDAWQYSCSRDFLEAFYPLVEACVSFQQAWLVQKDWSLRKVGSLDENPHLRKNDSWTLATVIRSAEIFIAVCQALGREPPEAARSIAPLRATLQKNFHKNSLLAYPSARKQSLGAVIPYRLLPDMEHFDNSWDAYTQDSMEAEGLGFGPYTHARGRIFPWIQAKAAATRTRMRRPGVWKDWLEPMLNYVDQWGGFPEVWRHNRDISMPYYLGAHGFYLTALAELIADRKADQIDILWDLPEAWHSLHFNNITLPGKLLVSGEVTQGKTKALQIDNASSNPVGPLKIRYPNRDTCKPEVTHISLAPGETWVL